VRYFGLTPAQYLCFILLLIGVGTAMWTPSFANDGVDKEGA